VITYKATAGMFIPRQELTSRSDGVAVIRFGDEAPRQVQLPEAATAQLRRLLRRAGFAKLRPHYGPAGLTDQPTEKLTYGGKTVVAEALAAPDKFRAVLAQLREIIAAADDPFVADITVFSADFVHVRVHGDGRAVVETADDRQERSVSTECVATVRHLAGRAPARMRPGLVPTKPFWNPPPTLVLRHEFTAWHARLRRSSPKRVKQLEAVARQIARGDC